MVIPKKVAATQQKLGNYPNFIRIRLKILPTISKIPSEKNKPNKISERRKMI